MRRELEVSLNISHFHCPLSHTDTEIASNIYMYYDILNGTTHSCTDTEIAANIYMHYDILNGTSQR